MFQFLEVYIVLSDTYTIHIKADIKLEMNWKNSKQKNLSYLSSSECLFLHHDFFYEQQIAGSVADHQYQLYIIISNMTCDPVSISIFPLAPNSTKNAECRTIQVFSECYWTIQRSRFARVKALCNLSWKKMREATVHFRADFWVGVASLCV